MSGLIEFYLWMLAIFAIVGVAVGLICALMGYQQDGRTFMLELVGLGLFWPLLIPALAWLGFYRLIRA